MSLARCDLKKEPCPQSWKMMKVRTKGFVSYHQRRVTLIITSQTWFLIVIFAGVEKQKREWLVPWKNQWQKNISRTFGGIYQTVGGSMNLHSRHQNHFVNFYFISSHLWRPKSGSEPSNNFSACSLVFQIS